VFFAPTRAADVATATPIRGWQVQSSAAVDATGDAISRPDFRADGWLDAPPRSTVMAALLASGRYPDIFFSTTMRDEVDPSMFAVPWWYRSAFVVNGTGRTLLRTDGIIHRAELYVNGSKVAGTDEIAGAYPVHTFDVNDVGPARHQRACHPCPPGHPMSDLSIGWVDWNPTPPDTNMGVWRDVVVLRTGAVRLADLHVRSDVDIESLAHARLQISVDVENADQAERTVTLSGTVTGTANRDYSPAT